MTAQERVLFAQALAELAEVFNEPMSEARTAGYWLALEDQPLDAVIGAIRDAIRGSRFFPKPVELLALIGGTPVDAGWVNEMLSKGISGYPVPPFVMLFVERLGGWRRVEDLLPPQRLPVIERLYPGLVAASRARGVSIPTERSLIETPARRRLTSQSNFPTPNELRLFVAEDTAREPGAGGRGTP